MSVKFRSTVKHIHFYIVLDRLKPILGVGDALALGLTSFHCPIYEDWQSNNHPTQQFLNMLLKQELLPIITRPSLIMQTSATLIDNILVSSDLHEYFELAIILNDMSDNLPLLTMMKQTKITDQAPLTFKSCDRNEKKIQEIKGQLLTKDWVGLLDNNDVDYNFSIFCDMIENTMNAMAPIQEVRISSKCKFVEPWMTPGLAKASDRKLHLYWDSIVKDASQDKINEYKEYRNTYNKLKWDASIKYYADRIAAYKSNTKKLWQLINGVVNKTKRKGSIIPFISTDGIKTYNPNTITNEFGKFYVGLGTNLACNIRAKTDVNEYIKKN